MKDETKTIALLKEDGRTSSNALQWYLVFRLLIAAGDFRTVATAGRVCAHFYRLTRENKLWLGFFKNNSDSSLSEGQLFKSIFHEYFVVCGFVNTYTGVVNSAVGRPRTATDDELYKAISIVPNQVFSTVDFVHTTQEVLQHRLKTSVEANFYCSSFYDKNKFPVFSVEKEAINFARRLCHDNDTVSGTCSIPVVAKAKIIGGKPEIYAVAQVNLQEQALNYRKISGITSEPIPEITSPKKCAIM